MVVFCGFRTSTFFANQISVLGDILTFVFGVSKNPSVLIFISVLEAGNWWYQPRFSGVSSAFAFVCVTPSAETDRHVQVGLSWIFILVISKCTQYDDHQVIYHGIPWKWDTAANLVVSFFQKDLSTAWVELEKLTWREGGQELMVRSLNGPGLFLGPGPSNWNADCRVPEISGKCWAMLWCYVPWTASSANESAWNVNLYLSMLSKNDLRRQALYEQLQVCYEYKTSVTSIFFQFCH